ncbi:MAG: NfeD family protein [Chlorobia bacterium]|nr:NfeD family protein [Fimbriimonadaceae bacterium]
MLLVYAVSALVAGVLVLLSLFGAEHGSDAATGLELHTGGADHDSDHGFWLPFFSLRFYTYFFAGFGATGLLLHFLTQTNPVAAAWISGMVGLVSGLGVAILIRILKITETSGSANDKDVLGKEANVMVAIRGSNPGQIRCTVRGDIIDFTAFSEELEPIEVGETVIVVAMEDGKAQVVTHSSIFGEDALPQRTS